MRKISIRPELVSDLYDKDIIAFGTGKVGKVAIPYLSRDPKINILGASNTRVSTEIKEEYLDVEVVVQPLSQWYKLYPNATILVTIFDNDFKEEAKSICQAVGFKDVIFLSFDLFCAISYAFTNNVDQYLESTYQFCKDFVEMTTSPMLEAACLANEIRDLHVATFSEFKGCNYGKDVAVVGCGPTLNYYTPMPEVKHAGVNTAYKKAGLKLDYLFITDRPNRTESGIYDGVEKLQCHKFIAQAVGRYSREDVQFPEKDVKRIGGRYFYISERNNVAHWDIRYYPLMHFYSTIFAAINFALFTGAKRLYLVGCDCTVIEHFDDRMTSENLLDALLHHWISGYKYLKHFVQTYCPDTEVISINPIGLRGMFRDVYTESFLEVHPDVKTEQIMTYK